jgi:3-dehydroquinate dehydratase type I
LEARLTIPVAAPNIKEMGRLIRIALTAKPHDIELRCDSLEHGLDMRSFDHLPEINQAGRLMTIRHREESGPDKNLGFKWGEDERRFFLAHALFMGYDIDIELRQEDPASEPTIKRLMQVAVDQGRKVNVSAHDFTCTPEKEVLEDRYERMFHMGAKYHKQVYFAQNYDDVGRTLDLIPKARWDQVNMTAQNMGPLGPLSRYIAAMLKSYRVFVSTNGANPTANGQLKIEDFRRFEPKVREVYEESTIGSNGGITGKQVEDFHKALLAAGVNV